MVGRLLAVVASFVLVVLSPQAAYAHGDDDPAPAVLGALTATPSLPAGVAVSVPVTGVVRVTSSGPQVTVFGRGGEPLAQIRVDGSTWVNSASPDAGSLNTVPTSPVGVQPPADPRAAPAEPVWVADFNNGLLVWSDPRLTAGVPGQRWEVDLLVDDGVYTVSGEVGAVAPDGVVGQPTGRTAGGFAFWLVPAAAVAVGAALLAAARHLRRTAPQ